MSEEITIIIPSHNRHHVLNRAIEYYAKLNFLVLIVDSSKESLNIKLPKNIKYIYLPGSFFSNKIHYGLEMASTPFACLCADDDFLSESGLHVGKEFLQKNLDFVSVQGNYIQFNPSNPIELYSALYKKMNDYNNDSELTETRVMNAFEIPHIFALHRINALKSALNISFDIPLVTVVERSIALVTMCYGKHKVLPVFWSARDVIRYSNYNDEEGGTYKNNNLTQEADNKLNIVIKNWKDFLNTNYGKKLKKNYIKEVFDLIDDSIDIGELFDHANFQLQDSVSTPLLTKIKKILKDLLPLSIVKKIQSNNINKEKSRLSNLPGYPWSDSVAMHDWKIITQVIENNKELIKKETL